MEPMTREALRRTHPVHDAMAPRWRFWIAAYEGLDALLAHGVLGRHPREDADDFQERQREAVGFNYSRGIVNLFNFYLFEKHPLRELGPLAGDDLWRVFTEDCDLHGTNFDTFLLEQQKYASIFGHVGILVDRPGAGATTRREEREKKLYPYLAAYHPEAILDWRLERDANHRPCLTMIKLLEEDGAILVYRRDGWTRHRLDHDGGVTELGRGPNPLGRIPFVWLMNLTGRRRHVGVSDIADIALLDASIIRDLSLGSEIIKNCAFPMFRAPRQPLDATGLRDVVETGPRAVLELDPETPEARQDWLESAAREPVEAILLWVERKTREIHRIANVGGLHALESQARSGVALRQEFQLLNSVLAAKAHNLEEAERAVIQLWLDWQQRGDEMRRVRVERPRHFSVEDLGADLDNALKGAQLVQSPTFRRELQLHLAKRLLPGGERVLETVRRELEETA